MRGIALLRNARIQNANDVVNLAFGYASEEDRLELKKKFVPGLLSFPFSDDVSPSPPKKKPKPSVAQRNWALKKFLVIRFLALSFENF